MSRKLKLSQDLLLCCESVHTILEEKQKLWPQDWFSQVDNREGNRQANGNSLRRVFPGDCWHQDCEGVWVQCFSGTDILMIMELSGVGTMSMFLCKISQCCGRRTKMALAVIGSPYAFVL